MKIKAIIPAAGFGTRFLPTTKSVPKEMLPIVDKPAIQYIVEEGINSGIKDFVIVTSKNKKAIEDHFDSFSDLENTLKNTQKESILHDVNQIIEKSNFLFVLNRAYDPTWRVRYSIFFRAMEAPLVSSGPAPSSPCRLRNLPRR